jgi:hypothetical protein
MVVKSGKSSQRSRLVKLEIILPVILLIIIFFIAWYGRHNNGALNNDVIPTSWIEYKATKYGFKFSYPTSWGAAQIVNTKGKTGSQYQVNFGVSPNSKIANKNLSVFISMQSDDYISSICSSDCQSQTNTATSKSIRANLKSKSNSFIKHDDSSYAFMATIPAAKISTLTDVQVVNLPKLKVSGAVGIYTVKDIGDCPTAKFASSSKGGCITHANYDTLSKVLKSLEAT